MNIPLLTKMQYCNKGYICLWKCYGYVVTLRCSLPIFH
jgi:hypothetical protein